MNHIEYRGFRLYMIPHGGVAIARHNEATGYQMPYGVAPSTNDAKAQIDLMHEEDDKRRALACVNEILQILRPAQWDSGTIECVDDAVRRHGFVVPPPAGEDEV